MCCTMMCAQQKFFNLTAEEVRIGESLPFFYTTFPLGDNYVDSVYTVDIAYAEYLTMTDKDVKKYQQITDQPLPEKPVISSTVTVDRRKGRLEISFIPLVMHQGKYKKLVSFMLDIHATAKSSPRRKVMTRSDSDSRYADHSVLASGSWAKIRVPESGVYQITNELIRKAGFKDINKVHVYGYGGALQPDALSGTYLQQTDDLQKVPLCVVNGKRLFYAQGPVSWSGSQRIRNPYSDYGYYFITEDAAEPQTIDEATFLDTYYPSRYGAATLHEIDNYAWFEGGRNLFEDSPINQGSSKSYTIANPLPGLPPNGTVVNVNITAATASQVEVSINDQVVGTLYISEMGEYDHGRSAAGTYQVSGYDFGGDDAYTVKLTTVSGGPVRLDYISAYTNVQHQTHPDLNTITAVPEYVYNITNQDLHADRDIQMVIIIPTSQKLREQAARIKTLHEQRDGMTVKIVPADELFNEFSSGTPDAHAYRRYMKMLYDRAETDEQMPRYLLLFGDCAWDNRMNSSAWKSYSPDDFLLCVESENSFSKTDCYVDDGFFCCLDDGEGGSPARTDRHDIAVGRFPVRTADDAKILVDKTIAYIENEKAGAWQNTVMFMGDDGNNNQHMRDADLAAKLVGSLNPALHLKKVMWDAYTRVASSTGNTYPEVTNIIKQQQQNGALVMDYCGHGSETSISHEKVLLLNDFKEFVNDCYPLWITASCDIAPFDGQADNIGEYALLNSKGGAVAFFGTTRTVYVDRNRAINLSYLRALFTPQNGKYVSIGEAQRIAKNNLLSNRITIDGITVNNPDGTDLTINKLQYSLLGDPALVLKIPTQQAVVDSINGVAVKGSSVSIKAGQTVRVSGHIEKNAQQDPSFNGVLTAVVRDSEETIVCKLNDTTTDGADEAFVYNDRTKILFNGQDSVRAGKFSFSFAVPKDINYSDDSGLINLYAVDNNKTLMANGVNDRLIVGGSDIASNDSIGPSIYCYLNSPQFVNGGTVNTTPYFVAQISDEDGLNTTGNGIGHDLELIIDGYMSKTYNLNDHFVYDFGSYTSGSTYYNIPALEPGPHKLKFRAWDILNNSATTELAFTVVKGLEPDFSVALTNNPAKENTTFIINHDRTGSNMEVEIEVFDMSGRRLWLHRETGVSTSSAYTVGWNLTLDNGQRLQTGVYLYRVRISSDGSKKVSRSKKLIVLGG